VIDKNLATKNGDEHREHVKTPGQDALIFNCLENVAYGGELYCRGLRARAARRSDRAVHWKGSDSQFFLYRRSFMAFYILYYLKKWSYFHFFLNEPGGSVQFPNLDIPMKDSDGKRKNVENRRKRKP
jgi:hypothetical protein